MEPTDMTQADEGQDDGSGEEDEGLEEVGIDDRFQSAGDGVDAGGKDEQDGGGEVVPAKHGAHEDRAGEEVHGDLGENVGDDRDDGEIPAALRVEAPFEKLGHREDLRLQ